MKPSAFNAAFTIFIASCTSVQPPHAWGFCVLRAVVRSPRLEQHKCCSSGSVDDGTKMPADRMTRTGALSVFGGALVVAARNSLAAIPTTDDYAFGTGSKVKQPRKGGEDGELSTPFPKSSVNPNNLVEVVGAVSRELDRMQTLVEKERWGDALGKLRSFPLTALKSPTLGLGSVADVARSLGVSNVKAAEILEASVEAGLTLKEVEDVIFSNTRTLEFFNSADLKQVEVLKRSAEPTDLSEPLQLLSETKALVRGLRDLMAGGAL